MSTSTPQLARAYGVPHNPGVLIQAIVPGSQLDGVVEPGWVIVRVRDALVRNVDEFFGYLEQLDLRTRASVTFTFLRLDGTRYRLRLYATDER